VNEASFYTILLWSWVGVAALSFVFLLFVTAPYGRHVREGWGPTVPSTLGWVLMEIPAVLIFGAFALLGDRLLEPATLVLTALWMLHYVNRSLVFPFRRRGGQRPMPLSIAGSGFFFNLVNGYLQGRWLHTLGPVRDAAWLTHPAFLAGAALFLVGFGINTHADAVLRNLRRPGETGYKIPQGGLYALVSCPNYFGEMLEWFGWALATWSLGGLVFAVWTVANLAPRAFANHKWYRQKFPEYPKERKALVPFVV